MKKIDKVINGMGIAGLLFVMIEYDFFNIFPGKFFVSIVFLYAAISLIIYTVK